MVFEVIRQHSPEDNKLNNLKKFEKVKKHLDGLVKEDKAKRIFIVDLSESTREFGYHYRDCSAVIFAGKNYDYEENWNISITTYSDVENSANKVAIELENVFENNTPSTKP